MQPLNFPPSWREKKFCPTFFSLEIWHNFEHNRCITSGTLNFVWTLIFPPQRQDSALLPCWLGGQANAACSSCCSDGRGLEKVEPGRNKFEHFHEKSGKILTFFDQEVGYTIGTFISQSMCAGTEGSLSQVLSHGEAKMCVEILSRKAQLKSYEVKEDSLPAWKAQLTQTFTNKALPWRQQQMNPLQRQ